MKAPIELFLDFGLCVSFGAAKRQSHWHSANKWLVRHLFQIDERFCTTCAKRWILLHQNWRRATNYGNNTAMAG